MDESFTIVSSAFPWDRLVEMGAPLSNPRRTKGGIAEWFYLALRATGHALHADNDGAIIEASMWIMKQAKERPGLESAILSANALGGLTAVRALLLGDER